MLDMCNEHDGACGVSEYHALIDEFNEGYGVDYGYGTCDVVKLICQQVNEDTIYHDDIDVNDIGDEGVNEMERNIVFDVNHGRVLLHRVSVIWSSDIWSFWLYYGYMVNGQSYFSTKFFGYMVISAI